MKTRKYIQIFTFLLIFVSIMLSCGVRSGATASMECHEAVECFSPARTRDDVRICSRLWELIFGKGQDGDATQKTGKRLLCPGGEVFGVRLRQDGVTIAQIAKRSPAERAGLRENDCIQTVDGAIVRTAEQVGERIRGADGEVRLGIERDGKPITLTVEPEGESGDRRIGIFVRDGAAGIGTITFIDPESGAFGGLGHGICDPERGDVLPMREGVITEVVLGGVQRGECGRPGELHGVLKNKPIGTLYKNDVCGVFGRLDVPTDGKHAPVPVATREQVHEGAAVIRSTVRGGEVREYTVELSDIDPHSTGTKSFCVRVTDPALIALTGGIVRGMSGSPILQDGMLVGALTHVMINEPTTGYGIFIENMLRAANATENQTATKNAA